MKPATEVLPKILTAVASEENILCEGQQLANPIVYLPISGPSFSNGKDGHYGYYFYIRSLTDQVRRQAVILVDTGAMQLVVAVGQGESFNPDSGWPNRPRHVRRPDSIFIPEGEVVGYCGITEALKNSDGEDICLRFTYDLKDVAASAEMVIQFLLNGCQPKSIKYL